MNNFLKTRAEVDNCTQYLIDNGLIQSGLSCKNYDVANVVKELKDADILDMGSSGSEILSNAVRLNLIGRKVGIDLAYEDNSFIDGIELYKGDLMSTLFNDEAFDIITCLSVVEHSVDINKLATECNRLLRHNGKVFVSFDYWPEKINTKGVLLYNLEWEILCKEDVLKMVEYFKANGLELTSEIDWAVQDAVINSTYCSPSPLANYTFGILEFIKK